MRDIREVLRLKHEAGLSERQIARSMRLAPSTVHRYLERAERAGVGWPLPAGLDDAGLEAVLFPPLPPSRVPRTPPDYGWVHRELRRKSVTLQLLHLEYKQACPDGFQYSQFCERYRQWAGRVDLVMRHQHRAGDKLFVDYAGHTIPIHPPGAPAWQAELFVAVLGASNYTFAEATASQQLPCWIGSHVRCFEAMGSVPALLVPDNLRSGVRRSHRYEPLLNRTYAEMAAHYGTAILPARAGKPRDKAKAEVGVQIAERWLLASLRNERFTSLAEANTAIAAKLAWLDNRPFAKLDGTRRLVFEQLDRPAMRPLPTTRYEFATWTRPKVNIDYHVDVERHYYSTPYQLVGHRVDTRVTEHTVEIFFQGRRVASHRRSHVKGRHSTEPGHMPERHRAHLAWSPQRLIAWAQRTGPATAELVEAIMTNRPHPEQGYRSCLGIMRLSRRYPQPRVEAACRRALAIGARSYRSVESILAHNLEATPLPSDEPDNDPPRQHTGLRGPTYYR
ncbi:IS21 family transposase [Pseudonocardia eucalypti]